MTTTSPQDQQLEVRLADLERRLRSVESAVSPVPRRIPRPPVEPALSSPPPERTLPGRPPPRPGHISSEPPSRPKLARSAAIGDLVGGRLLAWIGGAATLVGITLFLVLAISRGWIGVEARVILAAVASIALLGGGVWLHARRGRTEASVVLVGVATFGLFATLLVASHVYGLIAPELALAASMLVGAVATALAIRWAGYAIAGVGLIGALISPVLLGVPMDIPTVAILGVAAACATWTAIRQRWDWLGLATVAVCAPQWGLFLLRGEPLGVDLAVLVWFGGVGLAGALGRRCPIDDERLAPAAAVRLTLNALLVGVLGAAILRNVAGGYGPAIWLGALAGVHGAVGLARSTRIATPIAIRRLAIVIGLILADVALGLSLGGIALAAVWAAASVGFAAVSRRQAGHRIDRNLIDLGVGTHITLTLVRTILIAPPGGIETGTPELVPLIAVGVLATSCLLSAHLMNARARIYAQVLNGLGFAAIAYLTAQALSGSALTVAWALEALALVQVEARTKDGQAGWAAAGFLGLAVAHAILGEAPPTGLITGVPSLSAAAVSLGAIALTAGWAARLQPHRRRWLLAGMAVTLLYLGSVAIITAFQPAAGTSGEAVLELSVRQQGQVLLSACWSLLGLAGLIAGLRRNLPSVRNASLAFLLLTVAKVFLYDLSTLTSIYRVVSFIAVGLLLLAGAFAYQRLRPPPVPDMRSVHPSQR